jgi:4,5-dihydroxyphthalate decarboxylase
VRAAFANAGFADVARAAAAEVGADLEVLHVEPIFPAFEAFFSSQEYDICELSIVNVFQALSLGQPIIILPVTTLARVQHQTLATLQQLKISETEGRSIGVRQWSQTTGVWMRGIMAEDYGVNLHNIAWTAYEDGFVPNAPDPEWVSRAPVDADLVEDFLAGQLDFVIMGSQQPTDARLRTVLDDPARAGQAWAIRNGYLPINHVVAVTAQAAKTHGDELFAIYDALAKRANALAGDRSLTDVLPVGFASLRAPLTKVMEFAYRQEVIPRAIDFNEIVTETCEAFGVAPSRFDAR